MKYFNVIVVAVCLFISSCSVQQIRPTKSSIYMLPIDRPVAEFTIEPQKIEIAPVEIPEVLDSEVSCLAHAIYYEARNQGRRGMEAVGWVVVNRTISGNYPETICGVVTQNKMWHGKHVCQFSWYCKNGETKLHWTPDNEAFNQSKQLASMILHKEIDNWMPHVVSFHTASIRTDWASDGRLKVYARIKNLIFYREPSHELQKDRNVALDTATHHFSQDESILPSRD